MKIFAGVCGEISERELTVEQTRQIAQKRIEADGRARALKQSSSARLFAQTLDRALSVADQIEVAARGEIRRRVDRIDRDGAALRFGDRALQIDALLRR